MGNRLLGVKELRALTCTHRQKLDKSPDYKNTLQNRHRCNEYYIDTSRLSKKHACFAISTVHHIKTVTMEINNFPERHSAGFNNWITKLSRLLLIGDNQSVLAYRSIRGY
ncbi:hypothetical protein PoB_001508100 [Plakobranchus ocellatus]|uniref:Uncharacterized protein n=1 Tax=Plakobranchus ocellatus TaxID=259542 RepID=A0AAV3YYE3_9GAST|nr:hypothetical protein PoB_001508100 [Plakobranchus ocellatus]